MDWSRGGGFRACCTAPTRELLAPGAAAPFGMALVVLAWWLWAADLPRGRAATDPLSRVWLDFRDDFGAVWGLRVMERMNASSTMYDWPLVLSWSGLVPRDDLTDVFEAPPALEDSLRTLLRRFVSREWIDERMASQRADAKRRAHIS